MSSNAHAAVPETPDALFAHLGELVAGQLATLLPAWVEALALKLQLDAQPDPELQRLRQRVGAHLGAHAQAFSHLAASAIELASAQAARSLLAPRGSKSAANAGLSLISYEDMDSRFEDAALAKPYLSRYADALRTMQVRLAFALQRGILQPEQNPFCPQTLLRALCEAWSEFQSEDRARALLGDVLRADGLFELGPLYASLNEALRVYGAQRRSQGARRGDGDDRAAADRARQLRALLAEDQSLIRAEFEPPKGVWHTAGAAPITAQSVPGRDWRPASADAYRSVVTNQIVERSHAAPLWQFLAEVQRAPSDMAGGPAPSVSYLSELQQSVPQGRLTRSDETTLDLLAKVFDSVFHDPQIPQEVRELMQFLQIPVLKAALLDKEFFFQDAHPARRLLDLMSRLGWEQRRAPDDPVFQAMQRSVDRVGRDFQDEMTVFAEAVDELEQSIEAAEEQTQEAIAAPVADAMQVEKRAQARRQASDLVAVRVESAAVDPVVEDFLAQRWVDVMSLAYDLEEEKPGAVRHATATMDNLIWSVKPKLSPAQRKNLLEMLPKLLAALNAWLDRIGWQDGQRAQFFSRLAEIHASIVRAPLSLSAEQQLALAAEAAQQDALKQQQAEQRLRERKAEEESARALAVETDPVAQLLATAARGQWFVFTEPDAAAPRKVKLAWVSPLRSLFIFSNGAQQAAFTMSDAELDTALRAGHARAMENDSVVAASLDSAVNDAQMQRIA